MVVGITGGIGSGKTTVANLFNEIGNIALYFADDEAKKLMHTSSVIKENLITEFSEKVYKESVLDRNYLAKIVFTDKNKLERLKAIVHPEVILHFKNFVQQNLNKDYILYENAIIFENGNDFLCDKIITVTAPIEEKINRAIKRDKTTKEEVLNRIKNQWSDAKKIQTSHYFIENINLPDTKLRVSKIHQKLLYLKA